MKDLEYSIDYYHTLEGRRVALQILDFNFKDNVRKNVIPEIEYSIEKYSPFYIQQRVEYYKRLWEALMPYPVKVFCFDAYPYYVFCIYLDRKDN